MRRTLKAVIGIATASLFCTAAIAQTSNTITTQSNPNVPSTQIPPPPPPPPSLSSADSAKAIGRPHFCGGAWYPPKAARLGEEGTVVLGFTITVEGSVTDIRVVSSSGSDDLDRAAVACAAHWIYKPAMQNGQPIAVTWKAKVNYSLEGPDPALVGPPSCPATLFSAGAPLAGDGMTSSLFFHIKSDGSVRDVVVDRSSGDDTRDQLAIKCVSQWRYVPGGKDASVADILWETTIGIGSGPNPAVQAITDIAVPREFGTRDACRKPSTIADTPSADTVVVAEIMPNASVTSVRLWQSSGSAKLDNFAIACVPSLPFTRAIHGGKPVQVTIPVRVAW